MWNHAESRKEKQHFGVLETLGINSGRRVLSRPFLLGFPGPFSEWAPCPFLPATGLVLALVSMNIMPWAKANSCGRSVSLWAFGLASRGEKSCGSDACGGFLVKPQCLVTSWASKRSCKTREKKKRKVPRQIPFLQNKWRRLVAAI